MGNHAYYVTVLQVSFYGIPQGVPHKNPPHAYFSVVVYLVDWRQPHSPLIFGTMAVPLSTT